MKKNLYLIEWIRGAALVNASSHQSAVQYSWTEWGRSDAPYKVVLATQEQIAYVKAMGGRIHDAN